jgi:undecaprenyl-diphosphatase
MVTASDIGARGSIWFVLAVVLLWFHPRRARGVWQMALAIGLAVLVADAVLKPAFQRARPFEAAVDVRVIAPRPVNHSFPSGHAATAFAGGAALARIWPGARTGLLTLACLIAFSRVYVGVHYPLDVIGGAIVGMAAAAFVIGGTRWPDVDGPPHPPH